MFVYVLASCNTLYCIVKSRLRPVSRLHAEAYLFCFFKFCFSPLLRHLHCITLPWLASCSLELTSLTPASHSSPTSDLSIGLVFLTNSTPVLRSSSEMPWGPDLSFLLPNHLQRCQNYSHSLLK